MNGPTLAWLKMLSSAWSSSWLASVEFIEPAAGITKPFSSVFFRAEWLLEVTTIGRTQVVLLVTTAIGVESYSCQDVLVGSLFQPVKTCAKLGIVVWS